MEADGTPVTRSSSRLRPRRRHQHYRHCQGSSCCSCYCCGLAHSFATPFQFLGAFCPMHTPPPFPRTFFCPVQPYGLVSHSPHPPFPSLAFISDYFVCFFLLLVFSFCPFLSLLSVVALTHLFSLCFCSISALTLVTLSVHVVLFALVDYARRSEGRYFRQLSGHTPSPPAQAQAPVSVEFFKFNRFFFPHSDPSVFFEKLLRHSFVLFRDSFCSRLFCAAFIAPVK